MSGVVSRWTDANIAAMVVILARHKVMAAALAEASETFGFNVTFSAVDALTRRRHGLKATAFLRKGDASEPIPPTQPSVREPEELDPESTTELAAFRARQAARLSIAPTAFIPTPPEPKPKREPTVDDDLAQHRMKLRISELEDAKKRLLKDIADKSEQILILQDLRRIKPLGPIVALPKAGKQRQGVPVMVCSDWHVEESVDPKTVNGMNEYNLDIAARCIDQMADAFEWLLRDPRFDCRTGIVALLGDLLSGYIHEELLEKNFLSPPQAIIWLLEHLEKMLRKIAKLCPNLERIVVACCDGNHGRNTHKIRVSTRTANSLEWMLYHALAGKMADDPRFEFRIADGQWLFVDVFGDTIAFTHGDSFSYGGGVGGITIPIRRGIAREFQGRKIKKFCMGHFHQRTDLGDILINGSMIGYSSYAQRIHAPYEQRQQTWFMWDSERGQAASNPIWLT